MGFETEQADIQNHLKNGFTALPIRYENLKYNTAQKASHVRIVIRPGGGDRVTLGPNPTFRYAGVVIMSLFVPKDEATKVVNGHVDTLITLWREAEFNGITCWTPTPTVVGEVGEWYQVNVTVPYTRDETV